MEKIIEAMKQGKILLLGEYRGHRVETIRYVDKKTGQKAEFLSIVYLVERRNGSEVVLISQDPGAGVKDAAEVKITAQKGKQYAFELSGLENVRGMLRARMPAGVELLAA